MRISIALCTYNGSAYLPTQLDSLLAQQRLPDQIVLCDDGSTDATPALLTAFAARAQEAGIAVSLHWNAVNLGYVRNFEQALRLCDGELLFLCDQDDRWEPQKLARYEAQFEQDPDLLALHSDARLVDSAGVPLQCNLLDAFEVTTAERKAVNAGAGFDVLLRRNIVTGATLAFRASLLKTALPMEPGWIHDEWLAMTAAAIGGKLQLLEWSSMDYRQHGKNQIGAVRRSFREKMRGVGMPRRRFIEQCAQRMQSLYLRGVADGWLDAEKRSELAARIAHGRARAAIGPGVGRHWPVVMTELRNRNYWRYSHGLRSAVADLLGLQ